MEVFFIEFPFPAATIFREYTKHFQVADFSLSKPIWKILQYVCCVIIDKVAVTVTQGYDD